MSDIGYRLLPVTIDDIAQKQPSRPWGSMARNGTHDFYDISFSAFANAINRIAWWITESVGQPEPDAFPTVVYIGPSDLRYYVVLIGIVKAGYKPLFTSHRNSKAANTALFESTQCQIFLCGFLNAESVESVDKKNLRTFYVPPVTAVWDETPARPFPFTKTFDAACDDPFVILHTSGSSGLPKPVIFTHGVMAAADLRQNVKSPSGALTEIELRSTVKREILGFPPFHAAGLLVGFQDTVWYNMVIVFPPSDRPLDGAVFHEMLEESQAHGAYLLPNVLEQIGRMPDTLAKMDSLLEYLVWVGGPISNEAGDAISKVTKLLQSYASTEIGSINTLTTKRPKDWNYNWFTPGENGFDFRPIPSGPGLYELFVVRDNQRKVPLQVFRIFKDLSEWPTNDLFSKHPTNPHLWRHEGRSDDLIVMGNGGNLNPRPIEVCVRKHSLVRDAMVVGNRRPRPALLIEPTEPSADEQAFLDSVWSSVLESNADAPVNGQIVRELVLVTKPSKLFPRSGKGTVQRGAAMKLYKDEIEDAYSALPADLKKAKVERIDAS